VLKLLCQVANEWIMLPPNRRWLGTGREGNQRFVDLAGDVAFQASNDLFGGLAFGSAAGYIGSGSGVVGHPGDDDAPQGGVALPVPSPVEPVTALLTGRGIDRTDTTQRGETSVLSRWLVD
jgi:hypothetical protein